MAQSTYSNVNHQWPACLSPNARPKPMQYSHTYFGFESYMMVPKVVAKLQMFDSRKMMESTMMYFMRVVLQVDKATMKKRIIKTPLSILICHYSISRHNSFEFLPNEVPLLVVQSHKCTRSLPLSVILFFYLINCMNYTFINL